MTLIVFLCSLFILLAVWYITRSFPEAADTETGTATVRQLIAEQEEATKWRTEAANTAEKRTGTERYAAASSTAYFRLCSSTSVIADQMFLERKDGKVRSMV